MPFSTQAIKPHKLFWPIWIGFMCFTHSSLYQPKLPDNFGVIFLTKSIQLGNIWRRIVHENPIYNSPSNVLWIHASFLSYFQNFERLRRHLSSRSPGMIGYKYKITRYIPSIVNSEFDIVRTPRKKHQFMSSDQLTIHELLDTQIQKMGHSNIWVGILDTLLISRKLI